MTSILGVKCSRKAVRLDGIQERIAAKLAEKLAKKSFRKYAKVHPTPSPLTPELFKASSQIHHSRPQNQLIPEGMTTGDCAPKSRSVRVVVTKKQLKQMLSNAEALKSMGVTIQFAGDRPGEKEGTSPRWRPSLAASIAE